MKKNDDYSYENLPVSVQQELGQLARSLNFNPKKLPSIIEERVCQIEKYSVAKIEAERAADKASEAAKKAKECQVTWISGKKVAIENLQSAVMEQSSAINSLVLAQKNAFNSINKLAEVENFLLAIGVMNTGLNRMVIRELELRLKNASKERLSELARLEIESIIKQLHAQEDANRRIEVHASALKEHDRLLNSTTEELKVVRSELSRSIVKAQKAVEDKAAKDLESAKTQLSDSIENTRKVVEDMAVKSIAEAKASTLSETNDNIELFKKNLEDERILTAAKLKKRLTISYIVGSVGVAGSITTLVLSLLNII